MSNRSRRIILAALALWLLAVTCNLPSNAPSNIAPPQSLNYSDEDLANTAVARILTANPNAAAAETSAPVASDTPSPTASPTATQCTPIITATTDVNVRYGPGSIYDPPIGALTAGSTAPLDGRNDSGSWFYITFPSGPGGHGWVSASYSTASCVPQALAVIAAPPTPTSPPPTNTEHVAINPHIVVTAFLNPHLILAGDIKIVEIFQSTSKKIILRVGVTPTGAFDGTIQYKVWLDGTLKETQWVNLPTGEVAYWTQVSVPGGNHTVRAKVDTTGKFTESNENNNDVTVTCNGYDLSCN